MMNEIGHVCELVRYPVKSMAGTATESAFLGWHGFDGDRRFAFRRVEDHSGFPWLTASRVAELILYHPLGLDESTGEPLPTQVRTPSGKQLDLRGAALRDEIGARLGGDVELMMLRNGIFDDAPVSVISTGTISGIGRDVGIGLDRRRFRANIVLETRERGLFPEDGWVGGTLMFGSGEPKPAVTITARDVRCVMVNIDPDTAAKDARVMKSVSRMNKNTAGVYGTVVHPGTIRVGDPVSIVMNG